MVIKLFGVHVEVGFLLEFIQHCENRIDNKQIKQKHF